MRLKLLAMAPLLLTVGFVTVPIAHTQAVPANSYIASDWQPIARIAPTRPYKVQLINQSGAVLEYSSTTSEFSPRQLRPGSRAMITQLPLPVYLLISPTDPRFNLKYDVSASKNLVTVKVRPLPEDRPGNTTVNVQETGGIYVY